MGPHGLISERKTSNRWLGSLQRFRFYLDTVSGNQITRIDPVVTVMYFANSSALDRSRHEYYHAIPP